MEEKEIIMIESPTGETLKAELVTYLVSEDKTKIYIVYTTNEKEENEDQVIYISRIVASTDNSIKVEEITDDEEWLNVQKLLKKIANQ